MSNKRANDLVAAVLDEVITEAKKDKSYEPKVKDCVCIVRGAMTGMEGDVTYIDPSKTLADIKFSNGQVGRVSTRHLQKKAKSAVKKK